MNISERLGLGTFFLIVSRLIVRSLGIVNIAIFARLLSPSDFGTMALAMASYAIIQSLGSVNFANAIVRERNPDQSILDTAFTLNFIRSVLVGSAVFLVAYFWGGLWLPREAQVLLMTMAVLPLIGGFYSPRLALVEADMRYGKIMVASSLSKVVSVAVGVSVAVLYQN